MLNVGVYTLPHMQHKIITIAHFLQQLLKLALLLHFTLVANIYIVPSCEFETLCDMSVFECTPNSLLNLWYMVFVSKRSKIYFRIAYIQKIIHKVRKWFSKANLLSNWGRSVHPYIRLSVNDFSDRVRHDLTVISIFT